MATGETRDAVERQLLEEAARKSDVCWVSYGDPRARVECRLLWHVWHDGALVVVVGDGEQAAPGLREAGRAEVALRSRDTGGLLVRGEVVVAHLTPQDPSWPAATAALVQARLNLAEPAEAVRRWADTATVLVLRPLG